ncbi:uncharacterized protein [Aristolochia californica]|uniref:uncharacterized protein n=1 Tax=Aristolochia californica TaxID=171875 RepID=UPI0035D7A3B1
MPSVGTRRSTRVFVPKSVKTSPDADTVRVLRSGKRLLSDTAKTHGEDDDWLKLLGSPGVDAADLRRWKRENRWQEKEMAEAECNLVGVDNSGDVCVERSAKGAQGVLPAKVDEERMFGIVYSRKRRRAKDRMYGIQFVRKQRRRKGLPVLGTESGKLENCLRGFVCRWASLVIFVKFSRSSLVRFERLFISVLSWMKRSQLGLAEFAAFLLSESMSVVFSQHGIHFAVQCNSRDHLPSGDSCRDTLSTDGICRVYGTCHFVPSVSVNFSALPFYFMNLHVDMLIRSLCLPRLLANYLQSLLTSTRGDIIVYTDWTSRFFKEMCIHQRVSAFSTNSSQTRNMIHYGNKATNAIVGKVANRQGVKFRRHKKRNSARLGRGPRHPLATRGLHGLVKLPSVADSFVSIIVGKSCTAYDSDLFDGRDDYSVFSSPRPNGRRRKSVRYNPSEKLKELKSVLVDPKQNVDTIRCAANILVMQSDRCWRECGAEVMLENSDSKEWWLAIKTQSITRYLHKAQEMRPSTCNRFTHAMIWMGEDGWKLEFCDRKDWMIFKELYRECCERNLQASAVKIIPVPGVQEVVGYDNGDNVPFVRPDVYISVEDDEIQRALMADSLYYDMDSGDEEWLEELHCDFVASDNSEAGHISKDNFEKIMYAFEKAAYIHPDDVLLEESKAISLCVDLGRREILTAVFDYWLKKRKQKKAPLVRVFQGPPLKRAQLVQKPIFRKKRSFKRQASQVGRTRADSFLDGEAKEDAVRRVQEAEQAAKKAMELATAKRSRVQMLMHNADLLIYKSVMAARIAEAAQLGESCDATTSLVLG